MSDAMKLCFQTVGVAGLNRDTMADSLARLAKMGYDGVEFAGYKGWMPVELRKLLDDLGMVCVGSHFSPQEVFENTNWAVDAALALGMRSMGVPGLDAPAGEYNSEAVDRYIPVVGRVIETARRQGLRVYMHVGPEFYDTNSAGECFVDEILRKAPDLDIQVDTIWCLLGCQDPVAYIEKYAGRETLLHYKDLTEDIYRHSNKRAEGTYRERYAYAIQYADTPSGLGIQDGEAILHAARRVGIESVIVEQMGDANGITRDDSLVIARKAHDAMRDLLRRYT